MIQHPTASVLHSFYFGLRRKARRRTARRRVLSAHSACGPFRRAVPVVVVLVVAILLTTIINGSSPASAATGQTASCVDGGGMHWRARIVWKTGSQLAAGVRGDV